MGMNQPWLSERAFSGSRPVFRAGLHRTQSSPRAPLGGAPSSGLDRYSRRVRLRCQSPTLNRTGRGSAALDDTEHSPRRTLRALVAERPHQLLLLATGTDVTTRPERAVPLAGRTRINDRCQAGRHSPHPELASLLAMAHQQSRRRKRRWDRNLTVAVIAASAAIAGAGVGGLVSYWGNRTLQHDQSTATARGIARVLEAEFVDDEQRLALSLQQGTIIVPNPASTISLSVDNEELLASNLSAKAWTEVSTTLATINLEGGLFESSTNVDILKARTGAIAPLGGGLLGIERSLLRELESSVSALRGLAQS